MTLFCLKRTLWGVLSGAALALLFFPLAAAAQPSLRGRVVTAEGGLPLPGANVAVRADASSAELLRGAVTDADGTFVIGGLVAGRYAVRVSYVGFASETRTVEVASDPVTLAFSLEAATLESGEVVVEGARRRAGLATQTVAVLEAETLERTRGQTLGAMLAKLPGVTTLSTGPSIAKPVVRGLHSDRVLVLNHGVRQEGQQWGGEHAPEIDPFSAGRIEVIKGAAGVEYGVGAIGGVIRVEPEPLPTGSGIGGEVGLNAFSNNMQGAGSARLEGGLGAVPGLGWRVQGSLRRAGDARTPDYVIGNSAFEEHSGAATLGYEAGHYNVELHASRFATTLGIFRGAHVSTLDGLREAIARERPAVDYAFSYDIDAPKQEITHDLVTLKGGAALGSGRRLEVQYALQRNHRTEYDAHRLGGRDPLERPAFELMLATHTLEAKLRDAAGAWQGAAGLSAMNQGNVNGQAGQLIPNFRALTSGVFAWGRRLAGAWTLEAGGRADLRWMRAHPREFGGRGGFTERIRQFAGVSGMVGAERQLSEAWSVAAHVGTAWRPPGVNELYSYGVHHGTAQFEIGEATLTRERSLEASLSLRYAAERARLTVSAFNNRIDDFIHLFPTRDTTVTIRGVFPAFRHQQANAVLRGLDGQAEFDVTGALTLGANASVVRGTDRDLGRPLVYMPADRLSLSGALRLPTPGPVRGAALRAEGTVVREQTRVPEGVDFASPPAGYALLSAGLEATLPLREAPVRLYLSVENLLNTAYRDYLSRFRYFTDDPGRNVTLRVQVPLGVGRR